MDAGGTANLIKSWLPASCGIEANDVVLDVDVDANVVAVINTTDAVGGGGGGGNVGTAEFVWFVVAGGVVEISLLFFSGCGRALGGCTLLELLLLVLVVLPPPTASGGVWVTNGDGADVGRTLPSSEDADDDDDGRGGGGVCVVLLLLHVGNGLPAADSEWFGAMGGVGAGVAGGTEADESSPVCRCSQAFFKWRGLGAVTVTGR